MSTSRMLRATSALTCVAMVLSTPALAQNETDDGFLGTIILGESKREVATDTATSVTTIEQTEIEDRQAGTVAELIDTVPGVTLVNGATAAGSGISIRGFGANGTFGTDQKVLIQIDGATKGGEELYRIGTQLFTDPFLYKSARVIRGTVGSFEYGSGVVGGAVILETIDGSDVTGGEPGWAFRQVLEFSSNGNGVAGSSTLAYQSDDGFEAVLNFSRRKLDVREDGEGNQINPTAGGFNDPSFLVKLKYTFGEGDAHSISLSATRTTQSQRDVPYDTFANVNFGNVNRDIKNDTLSIRYNYNPPENDLVDLDVELTFADEEVLSEAVAGPSGLLDADNRYETTTLRFRNTALFSTGSINHELRTGIEFIHRDREDEVAGSAPGGTRDIIAAYVVDEIAVNDNFTITPALRWEYQEMTGYTVTPTTTYVTDALMGGLSLRYEFDSGFSIFGSAAYTQGLPILDDIQRVDRIRTEEGTVYELGFGYDGNDVIADGDTLSFKVVAFDMQLEDITSYGSFIPGAGFINLDSVDRQGVEVELSYAMESGWYADLAASASRGDQTVINPGTGAAIVSDWQLNPADSLRLTVGRKIAETWDLSWEGVFNRRYDEGGTVSPGFGVHNFRVTYSPQVGALEGAEIRFSVENAFDKQYTPRLSTLPATGRNFKLTLAKTF